MHLITRPARGLVSGFATHRALARGLVSVTILALASLGAWTLLAGPSQALGLGTAVSVSLAPTSIVANGSSTSTATATVTGDPLGLDPVSFVSSDPGEKIGPVANNHNGTHTATITSSTTAGTPTITATDTSANASGKATLTQTPAPATSVTVTMSPPSIAADGSSTSRATATIVDASGNRVTADAVAFSSSDPGQQVSTTTNHHDGTYTAIIRSSTTLGPATITATDTSANVAGSATLTQTAGKATSVAVTMSPGSILADGSSTSTAIATVRDAAGRSLGGQTITFSSSDPGQRIGPVTEHADASGVYYTATITGSTTLGNATITATDTSVSPHLSGQAGLAQVANVSTTKLLATPGAPVTNQVVTLIATVTASSAAAPPSGAVTFQSGGVRISGCGPVPVTTTDQSATVTCQTSFSAATSPERLTAVFTPARGSTVAGSSSPTAALVVGRDSTATSLDVSNPTIQVGSSATYTATVAASHGGPVRPSGTVLFLDRGAPVGGCTSQALGNPSAASTGTFSTATCTVTYRKPGQHMITALYGGDASFSASASTPAQPVGVRNAPVGVSGTITSTMLWMFYYTPDYTKVLTLMVQHASTGTTIRVGCRGPGCPFASSMIAVKKRTRCGKHRCSPAKLASLDVGGRLRKHRLGAGSQISVELTRPGWIGKSYRFKMRAGHPPAIQIRCLAPGGTRPALGC